MDQTPRTFRQIGRVVRPHGVRGELKVAPETDDPDRIEMLERVWVGADESSATCFDIVSVRNRPSKHGITTILELDGVQGRNEAEDLVGSSVFADDADLPPPDEGEYHLSDFEGMDVFTVDGEQIGVVQDVLEAPGQLLLLIHRPGGASVMVPMVEEFIASVDPEEGRLEIRPIEGLL